MRPAAGLALLLGACTPGGSHAPAADNSLIDCAIGGAVGFTHDCTVERSADRGGQLLLVRHPDGGFRRFRVADDGQSLTAADGAEALAFAKTGDGVDVSVGGDRYRFPRTMLIDDAGR
jgi:hypothetical protein